MVFFFLHLQHLLFSFVVCTWNAHLALRKLYSIQRDEGCIENGYYLKSFSAEALTVLTHSTRYTHGVITMCINLLAWSSALLFGINLCHSFTSSLRYFRSIYRCRRFNDDMIRDTFSLCRCGVYKLG